ncbi:mitochondrial ribosomal death-associated protein 3-domain-containing protein [Lipomyces tetrasporus]|uniref:Small ribosomal subunit protein mS29 n=1 Tax=Lipomyces tetrasporus TaxID=54092 RepID=A0AAD7QUJ7_9ASCO|nr:mitochondrial ribosomal death-associated protein 3-domain-containing protein [Lipomyces tetrasporus]KAJ8101241.1 mitochondrial ribosomal death-associated protein 3-domain-containing protein [Lipomyces tetrasporus]
MSRFLLQPLLVTRVQACPVPAKCGHYRVPIIQNETIFRNSQRDLHNSPTALAVQVAGERRVSISPFANRAKKSKVNLFAPVKSGSSSIYDFEDTLEVFAGERKQKNVQREESKTKKARAVREPTRVVPSELREPAAIFGKAADVNEDISKLTYYSSKTVKSLKQLGAISPKQYFNMFSEKTTIFRREAAQLAEVLDGVLANGGHETRLIVGERGMGKSVVLQQIVALALAKKYFVIHISDAEDLVDGWLDYTYNEAEDMYDHPMYALRLANKLRQANSLEVLSKMKLSQPYTFQTSRTETVTLTEQDPLSKLLSFTGQHYRSAVPAFKAFMEELMLDRGANSIPVLFSVDNVSVFAQHKLTAYRDADFKSLPYDRFYGPNLILDLLSSDKKFPKGAVIAAVSAQTSNSMTMQDALGIQKPWPFINTNKCRYDERLAKIFAQAEHLTVSPFSKQETERMVDYYAKAGAIADFANDQSKFVYGSSPLVQQRRVLNSVSVLRKRVESEIEQWQKYFGEAGSLDESAVDMKFATTLYSPRVLAAVEEVNPFVPLSEEKLDTKRAAQIEKERTMSQEQQVLERKREEKAQQLAHDVVDERKREHWKRFVEMKYVASGNGVPRALTESCLFPLV